MTKKVCNFCKSKKQLKNTIKQKGGCSCGAINGGKKQRKTCSRKRIKGGSHGLETLPLKYYYQLNTEENNPQNPNLIGNSTKQFLGGKKNNRKSRKNKKNIKGGMTDVASKIGTTFGANMFYNVYSNASNDILS